MQESELRDLIEDVRDGRLPRRRFIQHLVGLGLTAPMASMLLMQQGIAQTPSTLSYKPTRRGGGTLKIVYHEAAVHLNPHYASGNKERIVSRIFYEPLAGWDSDGNLVPQLAAEIPSRENGGRASDGRSVVWKLKRGVLWHDGRPFTADDVVFTAAYAADPAAAMYTSFVYKDIVVEKIDLHTVRVRYPVAVPFWAEALVASNGTILPKHVFEPYMGAKSRENPANLKPVGTGPYKIIEFKPGDSLKAEAFAGYHVPNQPYFDTLEIKGGGDATSAARAVLQTGDYDIGWGLRVEDDILKRLEASGKGRVLYLFGGDTEFVLLNVTDPWTEVNGERASAKSRHPAFSDKAVRTAMGLLVDRKGIQEVVHGRGGAATPNFLNGVARYRSPNTAMEFSIDKANQVLDAAGWARGADGIRAKNGPGGTVKLKFVFQAPAAGPAQKTQTIIKAACSKAGIDLELKGVVNSVFFGNDQANPDTMHKFWADMQLYGNTMNQPDPQGHMERFTSDRIAQKANKWTATNTARWSHAEYDATFKASQTELDPVKRAALFIQMNDLLVGDGYMIPLVARARVHATANKLVPVSSVWDSPSWAIGYWYRDA